jgi:hypothetical protein
VLFGLYRSVFKMSTNGIQFELKPIRFLGRNCSIVCQNENGPCPLLALSNALILMGKVSFHEDLRWISLQELSQIVANQYIEAIQKRTSTLNAAEAAAHQNQLDEVLSTLPTLARGLDLNVHFTGVASFEYTKELTVFDTLGISVYHGWLLDPADRASSRVVAPLSYNHLVYKLVEYKSLCDRVNPAPNIVPGASDSENPLHMAVLEAQLPHPPSYGKHRSNQLTPEEKQLLDDGAIIESFMNQSLSQLTYHGLLSLHEAMKDAQLAVFFRNNHFSTIYKRGGSLYLLVTDSGYSHEYRVVWECLDEIDGYAST